MIVLILLVVTVLVGSLQSVTFLGRVVTVGDFGFALMMPTAAYLAHRQSQLGRAVLGAVELSFSALLLMLPVMAYGVGRLSNGTFLNGYRSLGFAFFMYVAGRVIGSDRPKVPWASLAVFAAMGIVLFRAGENIADFRYGQDVIHLVGYQAEGLGNNINNLNVLGMIWCSVACLAIPLCANLPRSFNFTSVAIPLAMLVAAAPAVVKSFSRSAYIYYAVVLIGFYYVLVRGRRGVVAAFAPIIGSLIIASLVVSIFSGLTYTSLDRLSDKASNFTYEIGYRTSELLLEPIGSFLGNSRDLSLLVGVYDSPQHSSAAHYIVMFGLVGFVLYAFFQFQLIADGIRSARRMTADATAARTLALFSSALALFLLLNDLATNALYYNPTLCYLAYFLIGLCRPYLGRDGR